MNPNLMFESKILGQFGLFIAICKRMKLISKIDRLIPKRGNNVKVTHGQAIVALIIMGLGFNERRLYKGEEFFEKLPIDLLFGEEVEAHDFNDDILAAALDAIYTFGVTDFFANLSFDIGHDLNLIGTDAHLDSTTISVFGKFLEQVDNEINITNGHSKDHRPDLFQITLSLATTGKAAFPIWAEVLSGNKSDKVSFHETIEKAENYRERYCIPAPFFWRADAALYTKKKLLKSSIYHQEYTDITEKEVEKNKNKKKIVQNPGAFWLTRVPENINEAKNLTERDTDDIRWIELDKNYSISEFKSFYGGVEQRYLLVFSQHAYNREIETLNDKVEREFSLLLKRVAKLEKKIFESREMAKEEIKKLRKSTKFHRLETSITTSWKTIRGKTQGGKQKKEKNGFKITVVYYKDQPLVEKKKNTKGRFVLATNCLDSNIISSEGILREYKKQVKTERSFLFLKDKSYRVSDVFLKKDTRVQALSIVMALTIMVHNVGQYWIRDWLAKNKEKVLNQIKKPINNPTLKAISLSMQGIIANTIIKGGSKVKVVLNLKEDFIKIIKAIGDEAKAIYGIP